MKKRILLADDDDSVRRMVSRVLEGAGYAVLLARTGREAVHHFRSGAPDLVLLDLKMPDQGGWEVFDRISQLGLTTPVMVLTAWSNQQERALQKGIDALMEKPLDLSLLLQTIDQLLKESAPQRRQRLAERNFATTFFSPLLKPEPEPSP